MDTLQRNFNDLDQQRRREIETLKDELKQATSDSKKHLEARDQASKHHTEAQRTADDLTKRLASKQHEFDSLQKDFHQVQQQLR